MTHSIRHHFVPQGFLRGFGTDDQKSFVWVYDKTPGYAPKKKSVRSVAWAPAYYETEREDGSRDFDTLESKLATTIDNAIPSILSGIVAKPGTLVHMSEVDKANLAFFIGLSLTRVPSFREGMNDFYSNVASLMVGHMLNSDPVMSMNAEKHGGIKAVAKPWASLESMVIVAEQVAQSALAKNWQFYVPPKSVPLVTTDNPTLFSAGSTGLSSIGPGHPGAELVMNLRKDLAIVCTPMRGYPSMSVFAMSQTDARKFNRGLVRAARQRVFADHYSPTFDQFVKKYHGEEQRVLGG